MARFGPFRRFARDDSGTISVESVIIFPILLWAFAAMFVYFDAFKSQNVNVKATYTVADLISRQTDAVDAQFIQGMNNVYGYLIRSGDANDLIVSVVAMGLADDGVTPEMELRWSYATGALPAFDDIAQLENLVPMMAVGDQLIVVHSQMTWSPRLNFGLAEMELSNVAFTRPRFTPQVVWGGTDAGTTDDGTTGGSIYIAAETGRSSDSTAVDSNPAGTGTSTGTGTNGGGSTGGTGTTTTTASGTGGGSTGGGSTTGGGTTTTTSTAMGADDI